MNQIFTVGQRVTIIGIGGIGHTTKTEMTVVSICEPTMSGGCRGAARYGTFKPRGKRKTYYLTVDNDSLVFNGWDLPILIDSEIPSYGGFQGNACLNVSMNGLTDLSYLRKWIEDHNLNPAFGDQEKAKILVPGATINDESTLLYPEIETHHAVINGMKDRAAT